jgi:ribosomal protein S16
MQNGHGSAVLDEMLEPVSRSLGLKTARALAALRVGARMQARVEKLAEKCDEGKLTAKERAEYEAYV